MIGAYSPETAAKAVIESGAMIRGSGDSENWTTPRTSDAEGTNHGDVAEVEFYGKPGSAAPAPGFGTAGEASIEKAAAAAVISLGGFAAAAKKR